MDLNQLKEKRNKLLTDMQAIAQTGFDATNRSAFDAMDVDVRAVEQDITRAERVASIEADQRSFTRVPRPGIGEGANSDPEVRKRNLNKAFQAYALRGVAGLNQEQRDILTTTSNGAALIPQLFNNSLIDALRYYGNTAALVKQKVTENGGAPLKIVLSNDTANGMTLLATETTSPQETDPAFQSQLLGVDTITGGLVKVSFNELEDSAFDLDSWLREAFGKRYGRGLETAVTLGKDSAGTVLPNQASGGLAGSAVIGGTTTTVAAGVGWDDLTGLFGALDPAYLASPKWVMNSNTRAYLIGLKDGFGRPYFTPDPTNTAPFSRLMGYDIVLNQSMPNMGVSAKPIIFGSLQDAYMLRTEGQPFILRLNERFADTLEVGFFLYSRVGGASIVATGAPNPLVSLQQAGS
jgi:HK97 family phage major capsid protein